MEPVASPGTPSSAQASATSAMRRILPRTAAG
jgi:hypothetical protein